MTEQETKLRRLLCDFVRPDSACDCWKGETCQTMTRLSRAGKLESAILELFSVRGSVNSVTGATT